MSEPLAVDGAGNALVAFHRVAEDVRFDHAFNDAPLPASLVALWCGDRLLLVFDRFRGQWELPGGMIDPGETPREAAVRELREETGHEVADLDFAGYAEFLLRGRAEYAAIYTAQATPQSGFTANDEIADLTWWDGRESLPGKVQIIDVTLGRLAARLLSA
ncbi:NUDIX domain-containing protein [Planotetraspora sp. A-T 1434]|uniref:NUDIX hydrolase n=1 Tax=Planotetraspora sp. A-T 1434 TaxID=2979219 RepID=UPI0021BE3674|nr:NUDIX domain-containing protein [Planotetraspora sp. A-T 1434]MCT9932910.1 NUDIX domain-containing protein [Planotetraspora sp. A-T 1434]